MARRAFQSIGRLLTLSRQAHRDDDEEETMSELGVRPNVSVIGGFDTYLVRVRDVKEYFERRETKRKRRLGFQLEFVFLCFFFPLCVYWNAMFGQVSPAVTVLATTPFPSVPVYEKASQHVGTLRRFTEGFANEDMFWQWMNNVVYQEIFVKGQCGLAVGDGATFSFATTGVNNTQLPVTAGQIRLRQVRVSPQPCPWSASLMNITCYPPFDVQYESTRPIVGPLNLTGGYRYQTQATTTEQEYDGEFASYPGSGYPINLTTGAPPGNYCDPDLHIQALQLIAARKTPFIDASTRAVVLTVTTFSPNTGMLVTTRLTTEISFSGTFHTSMKNDGVVYFRTSSSWLTMQVLTIFVVVIEGVFIISAVWGLLFGWVIESKIWTTLDLVTSGVMMYQMYLLLSIFFVPDFYDSFEDSINSRTEGSALWTGTGFYSGTELNILQNVQSTNSMILLFSVFRLFRYSQYLDTMQTLHGTISRTWEDIILYFLLLFLLSVGYILCGMVVLSGSLVAWSSYSSGIFTLTQYFVLIIDYYSMATIQPFGLYIAPIFLVTFILIFTWYMFAVFLAIIYVGYRAERTSNQRTRQKRTEWERFADENGGLCVDDNATYSSSQLAVDEDDDVVVQRGGAGTKVEEKGAGLLARKTFYYSTFREMARELLRLLIGLPERAGFKEYTSIIKGLSDYEDKWLKQNLPNLPAKRYLISFSELMDIVNGKSVDLIEELRRINIDARAEAYRRTQASNISEDHRRRLERKGDSYLEALNPVEIQLARVFRALWIVPEDKLEVFARMETDDSSGQTKRLMLVRIQEAMRTLDERETESVRLIASKIQAMRVVQHTMERDMKSLRDLLK